MKKKVSIILIIMCLSLIFFGCSDNTINEEYQLIRIHIRANSNSQTDQEVKLKIRDKVTDYLEKELCDVSDFVSAYSGISSRLQNINLIADNVLAANGFSYRAKARLNDEFFPTRMYENIVVESGYYDALIIELGDALGDNWWCVIYPPLCYLESGTGGDFSYKSGIWEMFKKYMK